MDSPIKNTALKTRLPFYLVLYIRIDLQQYGPKFEGSKVVTFLKI